MSPRVSVVPTLQPRAAALLGVDVVVGDREHLVERQARLGDDERGHQLGDRGDRQHRLRRSCRTAPRWCPGRAPGRRPTSARAHRRRRAGRKAGRTRAGPARRGPARPGAGRRCGHGPRRRRCSCASLPRPFARVALAAGRFFSGGGRLGRRSRREGGQAEQQRGGNQVRTVDKTLSLGCERRGSLGEAGKVAQDQKLAHCS